MTLKAVSWPPIVELRLLAAIMFGLRRTSKMLLKAPFTKSFSTPTFRGTFIAKPSSCVNIRVYHPKYKKSKDGFAMVLSSPGAIGFEIAPGVGGSKDFSSRDSEELESNTPGYSWDKKVGGGLALAIARLIGPNDESSLTSVSLILSQDLCADTIRLRTQFQRPT